MTLFDKEKPWERKAATREWDLGKNDKDNKDNIKDNSKLRREERPMDKRRHRSPEKSPEPGNLDCVLFKYMLLAVTSDARFTLVVD